MCTSIQDAHHEANLSALRPGRGRIGPHAAADAAAAGVTSGTVCGDGYVYTYAWICVLKCFMHVRTYIDGSIESNSNMLPRMEMRLTQYMHEHIQ